MDFQNSDYQVVAEVTNIRRVDMLVVDVTMNDGSTKNFSGVTEVHWNSCDPKDPKIIVSIESDYWSQGININVDTIKDIRVAKVPYCNKRNFYNRIRSIPEFYMV